MMLLDKLVSNCDYDCNELINGAPGVVLKFDDVCGQLNDVCGKYERLKEELDYLSAQRDVERNSHRFELNISLSNNDHLVNEKNTLEVKIKDISKKLSKAENTNSLLRNLQAEHDNSVNDYETVQCANRLEQNGGSHWSLLLLDNTTRTAVHYDSVRGLNERHAAALLVNLGLDSVPISEGQTFQQTESFECGVHVLVNARLLLGQVCDRFALTHNTLHHTDTSETHGSTNATLVPSSQSINNSRSNLANDKVWKVVKVGLNNAMVLSGLCATDDMLPAEEYAGQTTLEDNHSLKPVEQSNADYLLIVDSILPRSDISGTALAQFNEQLELMSGNFGVVFLNWDQLVRSAESAVTSGVLPVDVVGGCLLKPLADGVDAVTRGELEMDDVKVGLLETVVDGVEAVLNVELPVDSDKSGLPRLVDDGNVVQSKNGYVNLINFLG
ncbi:hypothetical protein J6590_088634 [Homalodisca vitripennis]|nr:hypothetical protein J6590_088634 [Homalodisca vitripennis]